MKVDGLNVDIGVESVIVEEDCTTCEMGHVEAIRQKLVVNVDRRLLQSNDSHAICFSKASSFHRRGPGFQL